MPFRQLFAPPPAKEKKRILRIKGVYQRSFGNRKYDAEKIAAALRDVDQGVTLKAASEKHGISLTYLFTLKHNRRRRVDAQEKR